MSGRTATRSSFAPDPGSAPRFRRIRRGAVAAGFLVLLFGTLSARAATFVADLSDHIIAITTAFSGADVLLFGAVDSPGDVVVLIKGDARDTEVRRKAPVGPIWINTRSVTFRDVPEFYAVAATRPLNEIAPPAELARYQIGPENLRLEPVGGTTIDGATAAQFRQALIRRKQQQGMFPKEPGLITFLGDTLFRTRIAFPANVPPGFYSVEVLKFEDGAVTAAQTTSLQVGKTGLEADLYGFALHQPMLYGIASIVLAVGAGWVASVAFGRGAA
ncbi:MAG: TIGR02186 family protein [Geminicoccaceae bacterium]